MGQELQLGPKLYVLYGKFKCLHRNVRKDKDGRAGALILV